MNIPTIKRPFGSNNGYGNKKTNDPFYNSTAWRNCRNAFMKANPLCVVCGNIAHVCDHKIRVKDGGSKLDWNNLQPMCHSCHNKKDNNADRE